MINSLNLIPYGNKLHFSSSNISNALDVFRKLRPRKYKYNRIHNYNSGCSVSDNLTNIQLRIEHSQLNLLCYINSTVKYFKNYFLSRNL